MDLEKCIWKVLEENPESSSFIDVRTNPYLSTGEPHPLYNCLSCNGLYPVCKKYTAAK